MVLRSDSRTSMIMMLQYSLTVVHCTMKMAMMETKCSLPAEREKAYGKLVKQNSHCENCPD